MAELAAAHAVEHDVCANPQVGKAAARGIAGRAVERGQGADGRQPGAVPVPGKRTRRYAAGVCGILGGLTLRFAVFHAGKVSALDPRATFSQQQ